MQQFLNDFFMPQNDTDFDIGFIEKKGNENPLVTDLSYDSRTVKNGSLYFALPGLHTDGHNFIDKAISNGALVILHQNVLPEYKDGIVYIRVKDSRFAMSPVSAAFYKNPSKNITVFGVTGTEGKSTTVYLIFQILKLLGKKAGFISTVQYSVDGSEQWNEEHQTTPEAPVIHKQLSIMLENGLEYAVLESSSHGLSFKTNRLGDVFFDAGIMTNVTHEHLEFHHTWEQYQSDKANLFRALDKDFHTKRHGDVPVFGIVNADDKSALYFARSTKHKVFTVSVKGIEDADISVQNIVSTSCGNTYNARIKSGHSDLEKGVLEDVVLSIEDFLPGAFNAANVLYAMLAAALMLHIPLKQIVPYIKELKPVKGRMTAIEKGQNFEVIVDYAHTPSSFETIFPPIKNRLKNGAKIISLFGSAGERDTQKRSEQGKIAAAYSDIIVLCDEDPRGEDPLSILQEIAAGVINENKNFAQNENLFLIPDRPCAIRKAFSLALKNDIVLLLGKGHENSIIYASGTKKYDEIAEAELALDEIV